MDQNNRKKIITDMLSTHGNVRLEELAAACGSSEMTIRRDLRKLEDKGYLIVNRGLVQLCSGLDKEISSKVKAGRRLSEKKRIAEAAAKLVEDNSTIYLDCGTTLRELALALSNKKHLTVYTNSLLACNALCNFPNISLFILPGRFTEDSMGVTDTYTLMLLRQLCFDAAFFGCEAVHPEYGFMVPDEGDCNCKREVLSHSSKSYVLSDSSKMFSRSRCVYALPNEIDAFITDDRCSPEAIKQFQKSTKLITV